MLIGLAGVTSTGKTTMANAIREHFGNRVNVLDKISRKDIYDYFGNGNLNPDLRMLSQEDRIQFDVNRVLLQVKKENELIFGTKIPLFVDGCSLVKIVYLIYLSGQFMDDQSLKKTVEWGIEHVNKKYDALFYLPVTRLPFTEADHRLFRSEYVRTAQDSLLNRLITTKLNPSIKVVRFDSTDFNLVLDEIHKLGI